eukprot:14997681-Ditylum_brightwellii.AAC.1
MAQVPTESPSSHSWTNITNAQGNYVITKSLLQGDALAALKNTEGINVPQTEPNYKQTMKVMHLHMPPLRAYAMQTQYMPRALVKPYKMSLCTFVASVNEINERLAQFPPRDDRTPQEKL